MSDLDRHEKNSIAGQLALDALKTIPCLPDNARLFHDGVEKCLLDAGFYVWREVPTFWRESGRVGGRIDLFAILNDDEGAVALELDNRSPRSRSMDKLRVLDTYRIIVLRGDLDWTPERGIDAIINIPIPETLTEVCSRTKSRRMGRRGMKQIIGRYVTALRTNP